MGASTTRIRPSIAMLSIRWQTIVQMTSMQIHFQMDPIGAIGMGICKATMACLRLGIRFHVRSTTTVHSIAGEGTITANSVWVTPVIARMCLSTLTSVQAVPSLHWVSMILAPKDGRLIPMHAQFSTTVSWCAGGITKTANSASGIRQQTVSGSRAPSTLVLA